MQRLLWFIVFIVALNTVCAQQKIPPFRMALSDGNLFHASSLPMGKPVIVIYFSPECDHCQVLMKEWFKRSGDFRKASVAMITFLPLANVALFEKEFKTKQHSNIITGTEGTGFFVRNYYKVMDMPFVALHDKNGNLVSTYSKDIPLNTLAAKLRQLK
ncbi:thioredoxin domain-containing protein [Lacibacter sediminis]|uniref:Redoxin domain-containing protein n=1 Tax=Lacibacter sediminis TaxID=2760713 RepID=A0A7G5XKK0_9BACT|nr:redoxin domain-containing protein [Lacibacter sediminis]QNA46003.1 redoxin domain-containing protein [Lacibacter sediminis]